jgi:hypothetical protein
MDHKIELHCIGGFRCVHDYRRGYFFCPTVELGCSQSDDQQQNE